MVEENTNDSPSINPPTDATATNENSRWEVPIVVGIGASAGGLQALIELFENTPENSGLAFVVIQHMAADANSLLPELLRRKAHIPVQEVRTSTRLRANNVYVIAPGYKLGFADGTLLVQGDAGTKVHTNIDYFLSALANDQQSRSIGIILSGSGSDGTLGLKAINANGGITFAQSESSSACAYMPNNAVASGCVDYILTPREIAEQLVMIARENYIRQSVSGSQSGSKEHLSKIFFLLRQHTGHDFSHYKHSTMQRRIHRRMALHHINTLEHYVAHLQKNRLEIDRLFDDILINVTSFFRDPDVYEALKKQVFPALVENLAQDEPLRIWVPGCSTGEEPYSIAIALMEFFGENWADHTVQIFATDIDSKAVVKARAGIYLESDLASLSDERKNTFFNKVSGGYLVSKTIRDWCVFAQQDVLKDPPFSRIDIVCCRNLLIYMDSVLQQKVLSIFHFALKQQGILVLGGSESTSQGADWFSPVNSKWKIYTKNSSLVKTRYQFDGGGNDLQKKFPKLGSENTVTRNIQREAEQYILFHYGPPVIIINSHFDIVGFQGDTGPFVEPAPGVVSLKLLKMVHRDLMMELRTLVLTAIKDNTTASRSGLRFSHGADENSIDLKVIPLHGTDKNEQYFIVVFESTASHPFTASDPTARVSMLSPSEKDRKILELERQLSSIREEMQGIIGEQLTMNEELQTANEEIQSANEELQSTNEELESTKEELQSTNEELVTVNDELETRNEELVQVNSDLNNLLESINVPTLMLSADLRIRQFTPGAKPLLNIIDSDIGRPFTNLRPNIDLPDIEKIIMGVIDKVSPTIIEAKDCDNHWYSISIRPYKTSDYRIAGAVLVFFNISDIRLDPDQSRWVTALARDANDAISLIGLNGNFLAWNSVAERLYGYTEVEALRMNLMDLVPDSAKPKYHAMQTRVQAKVDVAPFNSMRKTKEGNVVEVLVVAKGMFDQHGNIYAIALTERESSGLSLDFIKALKLAAIIEEGDAAVVSFDLEGNINYWGGLAQRLYGYTDNEACSMNFMALIPAAEQSAHRAWLAEIFDKTPPSISTTQRITKNGQVISVACCINLRRKNGMISGITVHEKKESGNGR